MQSTPLSFREVVRTLKKHYLLWLVPTAVAAVVSLGYALVRPAAWQASQALLVRDEAIGRLTRHGRFDNADAMKVAQETLLELARNPRTVRAALEDVGPPDGESPAAWPSRDAVADLQGRITVSPPKGAEFGSTEMIYLAVEAPTPDRATALARAVCDRLDAGLKDMRNQKAGSVLGELESTLELAEADLADATARLQTFEGEVGSDLAELRILNNSSTGESNLRRVLTRIESQLQEARTSYQADSWQERVLEGAQQDPDQLVAASSDLLESQPALRRLKEGLIDAQLRTATMKGKMNRDHPVVQAAVTNEQEVRRQFALELGLALRGIQTDLETSQARIRSLEKQQAEAQAKLDHLAGLRAGYGNLLAEVRQRTAIVEEARKALADGRAGQAAARSTSLLTRMDQPRAGDHPIGPGRAAIVLGGTLGGLLVGLGIVFLATPLSTIRGRRWTDFLPTVRRTADARPGGARATDPPPAAPAASNLQQSGGRRATDPKTPEPRAPERQSHGRRAADRPPAKSYDEGATGCLPASALDSTDGQRDTG